MELAVAERYSLSEEDISRSQDASSMSFQRDLKAAAIRQHHL